MAFWRRRSPNGGDSKCRSSDAGNMLGSPKKSSDDNVARKQQNENQKIKEKGKSGGGEVGKVAGEIGWGVCRALNVILRTLIFHSE